MGFGMTIGIVARGPGFIITVTDRRQSMKDLMGIDDGGGKTFRIDNNWGFLFAGDDQNLLTRSSNK
jgi:20S proteasome alpha/beta subunit